MFFRNIEEDSIIYIFDPNDISYEEKDIMTMSVFNMTEEERNTLRKSIGSKLKPLQFLFDLNPLTLKAFWNKKHYCCRNGCYDYFKHNDFGRCRWRYWGLENEEERRCFIYNKLECFPKDP